MREVRIPATRYLATEKLTGFLLGANVLRLELRALHSAIRGDIRVLKAEIRVRPLAQRVELMIVERTPEVIVGLRDGPAVWVDAQGVILEPAERAWLVGAVAETGRVPGAYVNAARTLGELDPVWRARYPVVDASDPREVVARGKDAPTLILGPIGQLGSRLAILRLLWEREGLGRYAVVDFRLEDELILKRKR